MARTKRRSVASLDVNETEDGLVIYEESDDKVHHLNHTAAVIFELCDGTRDEIAIADEVAELFGLSAPPLAETRSCLEELEREGLVH